MAQENTVSIATVRGSAGPRKEEEKMKRTILCLTVLLVGLGLFLQRQPSTTAKTDPGFVMTKLESRNGALSALAIRVSKGGEWKETRYEMGGGVTVRANAADGQFVMKDGVKQWVSTSMAEMDESFRSASFLESHPNTIRRESVAGFDCYIQRGEFEDSTIEEALSPLFGLSPLRRIITINGVEVLRSETLKVETRPVAEEEVRLSDVPTEFSAAERKAEALRNSGLGEAADALLRSIAEKKAGSK